MKEIIDHLQRVARANNDHFRYYIEINPSRKSIKYVFNVEEQYDDHTFIAAVVDDIADLVKEVTPAVIEDACENWNYKYVE